MSLLILESSDGKIFEVTEKIAKSSLLIKNLIEQLGSFKAGEKIPLQHVAAQYLELILEYCTHHQDDKEFDPKKTVVLDEWDETFFKKLDQDQLFALVRAANFLDVERLIVEASAFIGSTFVGKSPMEIRNMLGLK